MQKEGMKKAINILTVLCTAAMIAFVIYGIKSGIFTDRAMMEELVRKGGIWAPVTFILIQMVQVVGRCHMCSRCRHIWTMVWTAL